MGKPDTVKAIAQAEAEAVAKQEEVATLKLQRSEEITAAIAACDEQEQEVAKQRDVLSAELAELTGTSVKKTPRKKSKGKGTPRAKGQKSLVHFIEKALKGRKRGLKVKDLCAKVLSLGYVTKSSNIGPMVAQALRKGSFVRLDRGIYAVAPEAPAE